ncbi:MAG: type II secretion system GspH family protein, partial [Saccharofermentans sp.]|nr:type II secretion system GspH family protein [Saccharofermentans sp.]
MRTCRKKSISIVSAKRRNHRGFTLVELIVVLTILAILAAIGVASAVGYINRSKFEKNSQNAITVYQAAQTALSQKVENGSIGAWVEGTFGDDFYSEDELAVLIKNPNDSVHKTLALTYNPGAADNKLYDLLFSYFYDQSVFGGTISVEFDVSATYSPNGIVYSANVMSAFYSKENTAASGWDAICLDNSTDGLPQRDFDYRRGTSYVGYFDGTEASIVGPVVLPGRDPENSDDYLFTLRNGETLDITWAVFDNPNHDANLTFEIYDYGSSSDSPVITMEVNETALLYNSNGAASPVPYGGHPNSDPLLPDDCVQLHDAGKVNENIIMKTENDIRFPVENLTRTSVEGLASVSVTRDGTTSNYVFPLTISKVENDTRLGMPEGGYTTYTISIDCMMTRSDYEECFSNNYSSNELYSSTRLFGIDPMNVYVKAKGGTSNVTIPEEGILFERAIDDPVYFTGVEYNSISGSFCFCYDLNYGLGAMYDDDTHGCVINTLYGDLYYRDDSGLEPAIGGSSISGTTGEAVITSYRHLSNMRYKNPKTTNMGITFRIVRDLNWYYNVNGIYLSEVKVFTKSKNIDYRYHTPAVDGALKIVSFPALQFLSPGNTLTSMSHPDPTSGNMVIYAINNIQMRVASFSGYRHESNTQYDAWGIGLIGENRGKIFNIYVNNMNFALVSVADGSSSDYDSFSPSDPVNITSSSSNPLGLHKNSAVGGLVGINCGVFGDSGIIDETLNTISFTNCIVMAGGEYWHYSTTTDKNTPSGVGGIVGRNNTKDGYTATVAGLIEMRGSFAVVGRQDVGGVIGYSSSDIAAKIVVDGNGVDGIDPEIVLPADNEMSTGEPMSCVVAGIYHVGGAIGRMTGATFTYNVGTSYSASVESATGSITLPSEYQVSVILPSGSLIWCSNLYDHDAGMGGAVGTLEDRNTVTSEISFYLNSEADMICESGGYRTRLGGAIGFIKSYKANSLLINATNEGNLFVDSSGNAECYCGGAIGQINFRDVGLGTSEFNSIAINYTNNGYIHINSKTGHSYVGGAIGRMDGCKINISFYAKINNELESVIGSSENTNLVSIAAGAVGYVKKSFGDASKIYFDVVNSESSTIRSYSSINWGYSAGAVGCLEDSNIDYIDVRIVNSGTISLDRVSNQNCYSAGAIGRINKGTITNCIVHAINNGTIVLNNDALYSFCAGAIAKINDNSNALGTGTISYMVIDVDNTNAVIGMNSTKDHSYCGGAVGRFDGCRSESIDITVDNIATQIGSVNNSSVANVSGAVAYFNTSGGDNTELSVNVNNDSDTIAIARSGISWKFCAGAITCIENSKISELVLHVVNDGTLSIQSTSNNNNYCGGAVGRFANNTRILSSEISVTNRGLISLDSPNINNSYCGGAIGYNDYPYSGSLSVVMESDAVVRGNCNYVGGAIGGNNKTMNMTAPITVTGAGTIEGKERVGGAIGDNNAQISGNISVDLRGNVTGSNYTGGAIGFVNGVVNGSVSATIQGNITGGNYTGGAIGLINNNSKNVKGSISAVCGGNVTGTSYVGGAIGDMQSAVGESLASGSDTITA